MDLPSGDATGRRVLRTKVLADLLQITVKCWDPDVGQVWSHELSDALEIPDDGIDVGWLTYVANRIRRIPSLSSPIRILSVAELGKIVLATHQPFCTQDHEHLQAAKSIAVALNGTRRSQRIVRPTPRATQLRKDDRGAVE
jgi:hypothetical protein